mgnify:CR=1 FL=1
MQWLKHAFAVDPPGPAEPSDEQRAAVELICLQIVRRQLTTPALVFLEMARPLNFIGAQTLHFLGPFLSALSEPGAHAEAHKHLAQFLERRGSIDYICGRIEELEAAAISHEDSLRQQTPQSDAGSETNSAGA